MPVELNHTIVGAADAETSAGWFAEMLDLPDPDAAGFFWQVGLANGVALDFASVGAHEPVFPQHYAFLISEDEFDSVHGKLLTRDLDFWADPRQRHPGEINRNDGHYLEVITRPYGSG